MRDCSHSSLTRDVATVVKLANLFTQASNTMPFLATLIFFAVLWRSLWNNGDLDSRLSIGVLTALTVAAIIGAAEMGP
jgi:hypothetical protein